ncbi:hypothetical protein [Streptomyces sp. NPDC051561]|uniref:hypothetical protein n=1 Tax=Streptomyces sp. NPDC051561 TaxID=3365658 RepID=UPI003791B4A4
MNLKKIVVLAVTGAALLAATPAVAGEMYGMQDGAVAWSHGNINGQLAVKDYWADGDEVYADYHRRSTNWLELRNKSGVGTTVVSPDNRANYVRALRACQEVDFYPDDCSAWSYR